MSRRKDTEPPMEEQPLTYEKPLTDHTSPPVDRALTASYRGTFNGNCMAFDVPEGVTGDLTVLVNGTEWGRASLQHPLTVVRGPQLPTYHRITFIPSTI